MPLQLIFFVTNNCNCNCQHCNLRNELNREKALLKIDEIYKIASGLRNLLSVSLTGGEPFMRPDLEDIARVFYEVSKAKNLVIITNGALTDRILRVTDNILSKCPKLNFYISVSLDAIGDLHDKMRGSSGVFAKAVETLKRLKTLKGAHSRLSVGTATICSRSNQEFLDKTYEFIRRNLEPDSIGINLERPKSWHEHIDNLDLNKYKLFVKLRTQDIKCKILKGHPNRFLNRLLIAKENIQYDLIEKMYLEKKYCTPCFVGNLLAVLREDGEVFACEMLPDTMGNIRNFGYDLRKLWFSEQAELVRRKIVSQKCFCTYECAMTANIFFNPKYYFKLLRLIFDSFQGF